MSDLDYKNDDEPNLAARDSSRRWFRSLCVVCWVVWMCVAALAVWALYVSNEGMAPMPRQQILASLWWVTWFCVGLPLAVYGYRRLLERSS